jgi:hypothetical protein
MIVAAKSATWPGGWADYALTLEFSISLTV